MRARSMEKGLYARIERKNIVYPVYLRVYVYIGKCVGDVYGASSAATRRVLPEQLLFLSIYAFPFFAGNGMLLLLWRQNFPFLTV